MVIDPDVLSAAVATTWAASLPPLYIVDGATGDVREATPIEAVSHEAAHVTEAGLLYLDALLEAQVRARKRPRERAQAWKPVSRMLAPVLLPAGHPLGGLSRDTRKYLAKTHGLRW